MKQYDLKTLSTASSKSSSTHGHGNIDKDGKMGTASRFVVTDSNKNVTLQEKLGNITLDGKIGTNADYFVYTTTNGVVTSKQKIGNITTSGAIGSTANLPIITDTNGVLKAGSFSNAANTFAEGNHTHGSITNDGKLGTASRFVVTDSSKNITVQEKLGNITLDGKIGTNADYFVYTTTNGVATSKQKIGNITTAGAIGSTANLPLITTTSGVITTGSFGSSANTFCEGNDSRLTNLANFRNTKIDLSTYNATIDQTGITVTVTVTDYAGNAVANTSTTITVDKGKFANDTQTYTANTNSNGQISTTYTASEWGLATFSANTEKIQLNTTGYRKYDSTYYSIFYDERLRVMEYNNEFTQNLNANTDWVAFGSAQNVPSNLAPPNQIIIDTVYNGLKYHIDYDGKIYWRNTRGSAITTPRVHFQITWVKTSI